VDIDIVWDLALATALGLLVGLQREWADKGIAGVRTFALVGLLGAVCSVLAESYGGWMVGVGLAGVLGLLVLGDWSKLREGEGIHGLTTEVAALVMYGAGALVVDGHHTAAVVVAGGTSVLLHWKAPLHQLVERIGDVEAQAAMRLVLVSLVILPALPDVDLGPYQVLNPRQIWMMVVLIVGISLVGWLASRVAGPRTGTLLTGVLGGLVSSTATTASHARRAARQPEAAPAAATVIVVASSVTFVRVLVEVSVAAPSTLSAVGPPLLVMCAVVALISLVAIALPAAAVPPELTEDDPTDLWGAVTFGVLYAVVLLAVAYANDTFGEQGLYVVAALSGLTDVDAITLSTAHLIAADQLAADAGWRLILIGVLSNLVFKIGMAVTLGGRALGRRVVWMLGTALICGVAVLVWWP
jgi:uncharacterized membrane protein (DUF4010 family)